MDSFVLVAYASLATSRTLLKQFLACPNFNFRFRRFILLVQTEKKFYKLWQQHKQLKTMEISEVWPDTYDEGYIHQFQPEPTHKFTSSSSRSTKFKDILPWNISEMITKTISISTRIVISYAMKWGIPFQVYWKVNLNWDNMIRISQWKESHCRTNTIVRRNKSKRAGLSKSQSGIQVGKLTTWVRSFEIEKL